MKNRLLFLTSLAVFGMALTVGSVSRSNSARVDASTGSYSTSASTYYSGITATSGTSLMGQLHDLITTTHKTYTTYTDCKTATTVYATDPGTSSSYIRDFYTTNNIAKAWGSGATGTWNREHVWCQSLSNSLWGETGGGADLHHLRPIECTLNSTRNNNPYGEVTNHNSTTTKYAKNTSKSYITAYPGGYLENGVWEPIDSVKGDVARILMYTYVHYNTYSKVGGSTNGSGASSYFGTLPITNIVSTSAKTDAAAWALLLKWNSADPVDSHEQTRNEACAKFQGNRNPFIDNSSYANAIWGSGSASSGGGTTTTGSVSISKTTATLTAGNTTTISATSSDSSSITWSTSNSSVAKLSATSASSGSSVTVTGVAAGTATLTAKATIGGTTYSKTCTVTVSAATVSGSISISKSSMSLVAGNTSTINATASNSGTVTWSTSNSSVAKISATSASSGSNITVTGVAAGTATLTAKVTISGTTYSKTCSVTVTAAQQTTTSVTKTIKYSDTFSPALPTSSSKAKTTAYAHTDSTAGISLKARGIYKPGSYIMFKSGTGYLYNTASLGKITSVSVTYSSTTGTTGKVGVYFASSAKSSYTTSSNKTIAGKSATDTWTSTAGYGYFQVSTSSANVQIVSIAVTYTA